MIENAILITTAVVGSRSHAVAEFTDTVLGERISVSSFGRTGADAASSLLKILRKSNQGRKYCIKIDDSMQLWGVL